MSEISSSYDHHNSLKVKAPAKINLHLEVLGLRSDGFHELAMVMQSIDLADQLEISNRDDDLITLRTDNSSLTTNDDNLIIKAAKLLRNYSGIEGIGADIYLKKNIPIGAGLAGGSTDGAAALLGLNELWNLSISKSKLNDLAAGIGSDVPFCLEGGTQFCFGRGEKLEKSAGLFASMTAILLKNPNISVSTPWAYRKFKECNSARYLDNENDFEQCRMKLRNASWLLPLDKLSTMPLQNDLQEIVSIEMKEVEDCLSLLSNISGSIGYAMSGSGPTCFSLFLNKDQAQKALDENKIKFDSAGLESWICPFLNEGVSIFS